ncbi:MAG: S-layer homology domain-containing protein [Oscillospiraceae bacterium]|nr:S-layer homology domain-containing protein [Oscillospiraceae bacterium]
MRNLKRALSLALASVMLLGMMVVGSSAAFADADEIVNKEAVEITAGLGLFAGSDGKFDPKGTVTRAQMAAVIAKMFYGSDLNADTYKGGNKFNDTVSFEGGWAEGYINLGVEKGWFKGYGDGTFGPGNAVTTAEAVTMLVNLLGVDAGAGTWPMTVMAAAEDIELFDLECELKPAPATNAALTRDQLAVMVWNALNYSADGVEGYKVVGSTITFKTWSDAAAYADAAYGSGNWDATFVSEVRNDTLAETVFEIQTATGFVTGNQATGEDYTIAAGVNVNLETGLDVLGHFVTVYYQEAYRNEKNPGVAYCLVEEAEYVTVKEAISADKKDYLGAFGTKVESVQYPTVLGFDTTASMKNNGDAGYAAPTYSETTFDAQVGTYAISLETGKIIAFIAPVDYAVSVVTRINTLKGKESIKLGTAPALNNNEDEDVVVEYAGIAEDDVVIVKNYAGVTYLEKAEVISGKVTKTGTIDSKAVTYIDGKAYYNAGKPVSAVDSMVATATPDSIKTYDAYIYGDKLIGLVQTAGSAALADAIFVVDRYSVEVADNYGKKDHYYVQGVNAAGEEVSILVGIEDCTDGTLPVVDGSAYTTGFYTFETVKEDKEQAKKDIQLGTKAVDEDTFGPVKMDEVYEFFADTAAVTGNVFDKTTKTVTASGETVYLTADTKYVVINNELGFNFASIAANEIEVATYTGTFSKNVSGETVMVAATVDADGNYLANTIVVVGDASLKAEDYIYVVDGSDYAVVDGGYEYTVFATATNEYKTIVADTTYGSGFYGDYKVDEDGIYDLGTAETSESIVLANKTVDGIMNTSIKFGANLYEAKDVKIYDIRSEEDLENTEVVIETLDELIAAKRNEYRITFNALVDTEDAGEEFFTHLFISNIEIYNPDTSAWEKA